MSEDRGNLRLRAPPAWNLEDLSYEDWRFEVELWEKCTTTKEKERGLILFNSFPKRDSSGAHDRLLIACKNGEISLDSEEAVSQILKVLDGVYKKDDLSMVCETWTSFIRLKKSESDAMLQHIANYDKKVGELKRDKIDLPSKVLAMQLLDSSGLEHRDRQLVLTAVDYSKDDEMYKQMKSALVKFHGEQSKKKYSSEDNSETKVKEESVDFTTSQNWRGRADTRSRGYRGRAYPRYRGRSRGATAGNQNTTGNQSSRRMNPVGTDGNVLRCIICDSYRHFARDCPDSWENMNKVKDEEAMKVKDEEAMRVSDLNEELLCEAANCAVLDSACTKTVAGSLWRDTFLESLTEEERSRVQRMSGGRTFKFGGETKMKSFERLILPCTIAGKKVNIETEIVDSNIPLLLSKQEMKNLGVIINTTNDTAKILGTFLNLDTTSSGHYYIPLMENTASVNITITQGEKTRKEKESIVYKLHRQFGHPSATKLKELLKNAEMLDQELEQLIEEISVRCDTCKRFKKTPARPVVSMPLAKAFNDAVAMDLKQFRPGVYFLHMIDLFTRYSLAKVIRNRTPKTIVNAVITLWIASGLGSPVKYVVDNGGEFANQTYKEMSEHFNVEICSTAGESPWQNGICERNHKVTDIIVEKMLEDDPTLSLEVALAWAVNAKNALSNHNGFSPYQLVLGQNPNLPCLMTDKLPALEKVENDGIAMHLNALHAARRAYIKAENSERIRRALRHNVRVVEDRFLLGDRVYYKRDDNIRWRGPGKVIGQDGKIVFVRHGDQIVRVSTCRLVKINNKCGEPELVDTGHRKEIADNDKLHSTLARPHLDVLTCPICDQEFVKESKLRKHLKKMHPLPHEVGIGGGESPSRGGVQQPSTSTNPTPQSNSPTKQAVSRKYSAEEHRQQLRHLVSPPPTSPTAQSQNQMSPGDRDLQPLSPGVGPPQQALQQHQLQDLEEMLHSRNQAPSHHMVSSPPLPPRPRSALGIIPVSDADHLHPLPLSPGMMTPPPMSSHSYQQRHLQSYLQEQRHQRAQKMIEQERKIKEEIQRLQQQTKDLHHPNVQQKCETAAGDERTIARVEVTETPSQHTMFGMHRHLPAQAPSFSLHGPSAYGSPHCVTALPKEGSTMQPGVGWPPNTHIQ